MSSNYHKLNPIMIYMLKIYKLSEIKSFYDIYAYIIVSIISPSSKLFLIAD